MKKSVNIVWAFLSILLLNSCTDSMNKDLAAYYPFSGDADDKSGNNNNCIVKDTRLTENRFGVNNSAYLFDGDSSMIFTEINNIPDLHSPLSISWWYEIDSIQIYTDSLGAGNMFALVDTSAGIGVQSGFRAPAYKTSGLDVWKWGGGTFLETDIPGLKSWHHCVYIFDGLTHSFYLDGSEVTSSKVLPASGVPNQLMFGNYPSGNQYFKGKLDDIYIYTRALTKKEINYLFTNTESDK